MGSDSRGEFFLKIDARRFFLVPQKFCVHTAAVQPKAGGRSPRTIAHL
jgi:hypothetical protein